MIQNIRCTAAQHWVGEEAYATTQYPGYPYCRVSSFTRNLMSSLFDSPSLRTSSDLGIKNSGISSSSSPVVKMSIEFVLFTNDCGERRECVCVGQCGRDMSLTHGSCSIGFFALE